MSVKLASYIFVGVIVGCFLIMGQYAIANNNSGIHPIGENAVYIAGEACTVNMTPQRSEEEILGDMLECIALHREER